MISHTHMYIVWFEIRYLLICDIAKIGIGRIVWHDFWLHVHTYVCILGFNEQMYACTYV